MSEQNSIYFNDGIELTVDSVKKFVFVNRMMGVEARLGKERLYQRLLFEMGKEWKSLLKNEIFKSDPNNTKQLR